MNQNEVAGRCTEAIQAPKRNSEVQEDEYVAAAYVCPAAVEFMCDWEKSKLSVR